MVEWVGGMIRGTKLASCLTNTFYDVDVTAAITGNSAYSGTVESLRPLTR